MAYFINLSNHPSSNWSSDQLEAAKKIGEVVDIHFPNVPAEFGTEDIFALALETVQKVKDIFKRDGTCTVMCMGELSLSSTITALLQKEEIDVVVATSERKAIETIQQDGTVKKTAIFQFRRFRKVPNLY